MNISRFGKAVTYLAATAILIVVSVVLQLGMHKEDGLEPSYFQSNLAIFLVGIACTGTAVYSYRAYSRRHREHVWDSLFLLVVGLVYLLASVVMFFLFGGLENGFTEGVYNAANINIVLLTVLPLPFLVRGIILSLSTRETSRARRLGVGLAALAVTVGFVLCLALGGMMRMVRYTDEETKPNPSVSYDEGGYYV